MELNAFVGKDVTVVCKDGTVFEKYHVLGFTPHYDNYDPEDDMPDEDSIDIFPIVGSQNGVSLFESEIKFITEI